MKPTDQLQLTEADKERYEKRISEIDLVNMSIVISDIPKKIERLVSNPNLLDYQIALVTDISKLLNVLVNLPDESIYLKKRILFALEYFLEEEDEIPDDSPQIGLLDDYVLVRWVVDNIIDSSIKNNITFNLFEEEADKDKLERVIDLANLRAKINEMPLGLETTVGSDGIRLSGGERQRIAIARALYRNSSIFFMDEFTSSLDSETENLIVKNLKDNFPDKTMLIISHRESTIGNCDKVLKIDQGKLN